MDSRQESALVESKLYQSVCHQRLRSNRVSLQVLLLVLANHVQNSAEAQVGWHLFSGIELPLSLSFCKETRYHSYISLYNMTNQATSKLIKGLDEGRGMKEKDVDFYAPCGKWMTVGNHRNMSPIDLKNLDTQIFTP